MIVNETSSDYNGAAKVDLTSQAGATPSVSRIVAHQFAKPPVIDGRMSTVSEWDDAPLSTLQLANLFGVDNGINAAEVRIGYDREYVYMQVRWTEVASGSFVAAADTTWRMWSFDGTSWSQAGGDDRLVIVWENTPIAGWDANGLTSVFDGATFKTSAAGEKADLWSWSATQTYYSGTAADKKVVFSGTNGEMPDFGVQYIIENVPHEGLPSYMLVNSSPHGNDYPMTGFEYGIYDNLVTWESGATIPGVITLKPSASAADISAAATIVNGTWTVEMRRLRNTGNSDDVVL